MTIRTLQPIAVAVVFLALTLSPAEARRTPIPCTGDRLVKVASIPKLDGPNGTHIDLGYKFDGCFGDGAWIGYTGKSDSYLALDDEKLKIVLAAAGLPALPAPPSRLTSYNAFFLEWLLIGVVLLGLLWEFVIKPAFRRS